MQAGVKLLLEGLGVDLADANYRDTPRRVADMYVELFTREKLRFPTFPCRHSSLVIARGHECYGVCPHHLLPVKMRVHVGYIPHKKVTGLSKLVRAVEGQLTGPILQEAFTDAVADCLQEALEPLGVAVVVAAEHGCMRCRGVETTADVITSAMRGQFMRNPPARDEFLRLIGRT